MDFRLTEDQEQLRETARALATAEMPDVAKELEEKDEALSKAWLKRYAEMGFLGVNVSTKLGGLGLGNLEALIVLEEFAKISPAVAFPIFESSVGPISAVEHFAGSSLAAYVVPKVCAG